MRLAVLLLFAASGLGRPPVLVAVDVTAPGRLEALAGLPCYGWLDNVVLIDAATDVSGTLVASDLSLPLFAVYPRGALPVRPLFEDGEAKLMQLDEESARRLARSGCEVIRLPDEPFPLRPVSAGFVPRQVFQDSFVQRVVNKVSPDSIRARMARLQDFRTRYSPSDSCRRAEEYIRDWFESIGLDSAELDCYPVGSDTWRNPVGTIVGRVHPEKILIVCGHMDAISEDPFNLAPGMEDNGSGTAVALEAARVLVGEDLELTVKFIGFTGEEIGLNGSDHYARMMRARNAEIVGVLNFDMVSWPGGAWGVALVSVLPARQLVLHEAAMAEMYTPLDYRITHRSFPSDSRSFDQQGYPATSGYEFGSEPYIWYHTTGDTLGNCNMDLAADVAKMAVATLASLAVAPAPPAGFRLADAGNGNELVASWTANIEPDLAGYKLLWGTSAYFYTDSVQIGPGIAHRIGGLQPGTKYHATVVALDAGGHQSGPAPADSCVPLEVPLAPAGIACLPFRFGNSVTWRRGREADLAGYNLYRSTRPDTGFVRLNSGLLADTAFRDSGLPADTMYYYRCTALDSAGNESRASAVVRGKPITLDHGILLVDETRDGNGQPGSPSDAQQDAFWHALLAGYRYTDRDVAAEGLPLAADFGPFSTIVWHSDEYSRQEIAPAVPGLANHLAHGGRLWLTGWKPVVGLMGTGAYPFTFAPGQFCRDWLHLDRAEQSSPNDFIGASGRAGYPPVNVDSTKTLPGLRGRLPYIDALLPADAETILAFNSYSGDTFQGKPVGVRWLAGPHRAVAFGFPFYYMRQDEARAVAREVLDDLGEPYGIEESLNVEPGTTNLPTIVRGRLNLAGSSFITHHSSLLLFDASGRLVLSRALDARSSSRDIDVSALPAGVYFLRLGRERLLRVQVVR